MSSTLNQAVGFRFEGIGDRTIKSEGLVWYYGQPKNVDTSEYDWGRNSLISPPTTIDTTVDPFTGEIRNSSLTIELAACDPVVEQFLCQQSQTQIGLDGEISDTDTTIQLIDPLGTNRSGGVIYVGDEAIVLGAFVVGEYVGCVRGHWGTTAAAHKDATRVYTHVPYLRFRRVDLVFHDNDSGTDVIRWVGYIDDIRTSDDGTRVTITTREIISALRDATVNRGAPDLARSSNAWAQKKGDGTFVVNGGITLRDGRSRLVKEAVTSDTVVLQVGESLVPVNYGSNLAQTLFSYTFLQPQARTLWGTEIDVDENENREQIDEGIYPVFVIDRLYDDEVDARGGTFAEKISITKRCVLPYHPLVIVLNLLMSTDDTSANNANYLIGRYDAFPPFWGLGLPSQYIDLDAWRALIRETRGLKIDRLVLGENGEEVRVWDVIINKLLKPYGFYLGRSQNGRLNINRFTSINVIEWCETYNGQSVEPLHPLLAWNSARSSSVNSVRAKIGATPWSEGTNCTVETRDGLRLDSVRRGVFADDRVAEYDFCTLVDEGGCTSSLARVIGFAQYGHQAIPTIRIRVKDSVLTGATYDIGDVVALSDTETGLLSKWLVDPQTCTRGVSLDNSLAFGGRIIGVRQNIAACTYDLTLQLVNHKPGGLARMRAPSAEVLSSTATTITLRTDIFDDDGDSDCFYVGDQIQFINADGSPVAIVGTVTAKAVDELTATMTGTPPVGSIVRLNEFPTYNNTPLPNCPERVFVFAGDDDGFINETTTPTDIYA